MDTTTSESLERLKELHPMHWSTCLALPLSLSLVAGAVTFNPWAYTIQSTTCRAVDRILHEEVNITIGTHICAFLAYEDVYCCHRLCRHQPDRGEEHHYGPRLAQSLELLDVPDRRVQRKHLFHQPTTVMLICFRTSIV